MSADDYSVRIPADVEREDRILANLTARQVAIFAVAGVVLWLAYTVSQALVPLPVFAVFACPVGAAAAVLALGRRDGVSLDRLALAALRQSRAPRRLVLAPEGVPPAPAWVRAGQPGRAEQLPVPLRLPATAISDDGVIDLGGDGVAVVCAASTVSFALRTATEQAALVGAFARWLNALSGPAQVLVRAEQVDLTPLISGLRGGAASLPHPDLEVAAAEHADFLADLAARRDLLRHQVLLVLREPGASGPSGLSHRPGRHSASAAQRVVRRAEEAIGALGAAGISARVLTGGQACAALAACCNPWRTSTGSSAVGPGSSPAVTDEVITSRTLQRKEDSR